MKICSKKNCGSLAIPFRNVPQAHASPSPASGRVRGALAVVVTPPLSPPVLLRLWLCRPGPEEREPGNHGACVSCQPHSNDRGREQRSRVSQTPRRTRQPGRSSPWGSLLSPGQRATSLRCGAQNSAHRPVSGQVSLGRYSRASLQALETSLTSS